MTRFTSLLIAAAAVATMVGFATPGEARDLRQGNRCDWGYNGQANHGFQFRGQLPQFRFGNFGFSWRQQQLGPRQIKRALRQQGFHRIRDITRTRGIYRAVAVGRHGAPRQVFVHPASGQVLCVSRIGRDGRSYRGTLGHSAYEDKREQSPSITRQTRSFSKETNLTGLLGLGRYIRTVGDPNNNPALRSQFAPNSNSSIPDSVARQAALAYDAFVQRQEAAAPPASAGRRGDDRNFARNRNRR